MQEIQNLEICYKAYSKLIINILSMYIENYGAEDAVTKLRDTLTVTRSSITDTPPNFLYLDEHDTTICKTSRFFVIKAGIKINILDNIKNEVNIIDTNGIVIHDRGYNPSIYHEHVIDIIESGLDKTFIKLFIDMMIKKAEIKAQDILRGKLDYYTPSMFQEKVDELNIYLEQIKKFKMKNPELYI